MHVLRQCVRELKERERPAFGLNADLTGSFNSLALTRRELVADQPMLQPARFGRSLCSAPNAW